jgi:hypothetical protein
MGALGAPRFGMRDRGAGATRMIMIGRRKYRARHSGHRSVVVAAEFGGRTALKASVV